MSGEVSAGINRREFLSTVAAAQGAFVLGFWVPSRASAQTPATTPAPARSGPRRRRRPRSTPGSSSRPDDTVTIRIAQTELGQGVWTSNAMMVCEELQCDWSKVRPQYASANRDAREQAPEWTLKVPGRGATDPKGGGEPAFGNRDRTGRDRDSRQPLPAHADQRGVVGEGRPLLPAAGRGRGARAPAAGRRVAVERAGGRADGQGQRHHARRERPDDHLRPHRRARRPDAASEPGDDHHQAAGPVDADGHRAEEPRRAGQGHGPDRLRRSTSACPA